MAALPSRRLAQSPLLTIAVSLSTGIVLGHFFAGESATLLSASLAGLALISTVSVVCLSRRRFTAASITVVVAFVAGGMVLSLLGSRPLRASRISRMYDEGVVGLSEPVELAGTIDGEPEPAPQSFYLRVKAERLRLRGTEREAEGMVLLLARLTNEQIKAEYDALELRHGARIRLLVTLDREDEFRNPGVMPITEYLEHQGYDATGVIKSPLLIERLNDDRVFLPLAWLYDWRQSLQQRFRHLFSPETAGVLGAAILGNKYNISPGAAERFRAGGTFHVLVISGLQIAFIGGIALVVVSRLTKRRIFQFLLPVTFLWAYTIAVGADPSVTRSAFMFTLVVLAPLLARRENTLNSLGAAAVVLLVWRPDDLFDPSFQLTFLSVLSIVTMALPLIERMRRVGSWSPALETPYPPSCAREFRLLSEALFWSEQAWQAELEKSNIRYRLFKTHWASTLERWRVQRGLRYAVNAIIVSASVQIGMLPLLIIYFHRVSPAALVLNIFVGALMAVLSLTALAAIVLSFVSDQLALPLTLMTEKINWLMIHLVDPFNRWGLASNRLPHYRGSLAGFYVLYFIFLGFLILALRRWQPLGLDRDPQTKGGIFQPRNVTIVAAGFVAVLILTVHPLSGPRPDGKLHVDFLDVGQGDSALVTMPDGTTLMIDGGGRPNTDWHRSDESEGEDPFASDSRSIGERVVSEYLWSRGLDRVDYVLATHADADHIGGLSDVARNFSVRSAIVARTPVDDSGYAHFARNLEQLRLPIERVGAGDVLRFGAVSAQVLWPGPSGDSAAPSRNNDSIVLRLRYGDTVLLFTGDVEQEAELAMIRAGFDLRSNIVKVAHHGSKTSSVESFVLATRPSVAIVSVGRTSIFGHPNKEVIDRWRASGAQVMTTGERGTISVVTNGSDLKISTFVPP